MSSTQGPWRDVAEVRRSNEALGHFWFSPDTLRFFNSRPGRTIYRGRFFISSEQFDHDSPRKYTIRRANDDGSVDTVGDFQGYPTHAAAVAAIKSL